MNKEKELENLNKVSIMVKVNIILCWYIVNSLTYFLEEQLDDDVNNGIDISPYSNDDDAITTFPVPTRQRMALATNSAPPLFDHDSECIK